MYNCISYIPSDMKWRKKEGLELQDGIKHFEGNISYRLCIEINRM